MALDFTENCQDLLGTKKSNILPNIYEENFFKLAHYFFSFCQCNPISDIHLKHTDHCFQFFVNKIWSITNITRMPLLDRTELSIELSIPKNPCSIHAPNNIQRRMKAQRKFWIWALIFESQKNFINRLVHSKSMWCWSYITTNFFGFSAIF